MPIILNENHTSKVQTIAHFQDGQMIVEKKQWVDDILEANHAARMQQDGQKWGNKPRLVTRLPNTVYFDLVQKGIAPHQDEKAFEEWLRRPENRAFVAFDRVLR